MTTRFQTSRRRGASALFLILVLPVMLAFAALVVDLGYTRFLRVELQVATDAASWSAVGELDGTTAGMERAVRVAQLVGSSNTARDQPVDLTSADIELGAWDPEENLFTPSSDPESVNAVRVHARRDGIAPFFARAVFGVTELQAGVVSTAIRGPFLGAAEVPYYLPFGLPGCLFDTYEDAELVDLEFTLNPTEGSNAGWGLAGGGISTSALVDHLDALMPCMVDYAETGHIDEPCTSVSTDDDLDMSNGVHTQGLKILAEKVSEGIPWDEEVWGPLPSRHDNSNIDLSDYGHMVAGPLPVFDGGDKYCSGGVPWNETLPITGFVWAAIYDVRWKGAAVDKNVWIRLNFDHPYDVGTSPGGGDHGVVAAGPPLVVR